jgi:hypothetical protein
MEWENQHNQIVDYIQMYCELEAKRTTFNDFERGIFVAIIAILKRAPGVYFKLPVRTKKVLTDVNQILENYYKMGGPGEWPPVMRTKLED